MNDKTTPTEQAPSQPPPFRFTVRQMLAAIVGFSILLAIVVPGYRSAQESARQMSCSNNLKQITLAFHNYHDVYGVFPSAFIADANGKPMHSWRVRIMPFLESSAFFGNYNLDEPWDGPNNSRLANGKPVQIPNRDGTTSLIVLRTPAVYRCPSVPASQPATKHKLRHGGWRRDDIPRRAM